MGVQNSVHMFQIGRADFACPSWFSPEAKRLLKRILDPNPLTVSSELKAFLLFHEFFFLLGGLTLVFLPDSFCCCTNPVIYPLVSFMW